jgi:hypothetical protein
LYANTKITFDDIKQGVKHIVQNFTTTDNLITHIFVLTILIPCFGCGVVSNAVDEHRYVMEMDVLRFVYNMN